MLKIVFFLHEGDKNVLKEKKRKDMYPSSILYIIG